MDNCEGQTGGKPLKNTVKVYHVNKAATDIQCSSML